MKKPALGISAGEFKSVTHRAVQPECMAGRYPIPRRRLNACDYLRRITYRAAGYYSSEIRHFQADHCLCLR